MTIIWRHGYNLKLLVQKIKLNSVANYVTNNPEITNEAKEEEP